MLLAFALIAGCTTSPGSSGPSATTTDPSGRADGIVGRGDGVIFGGDLEAARKTALHAAFKAVIRKAVGIYVKTESRSKNAQLVYSKVVAKAQGYIRSYKIVSEKREGNLLVVTIRARVSEGQLKNAFAARLSKYVAKNPLGPCKGSVAFSIRKGRYTGGAFVQIYCPINDPTMDMKSVRLVLPGSGEQRPRVHRYGTFTSGILEGPYLIPDIVRLLQRPTLRARFKDPGSGSMRAITVPFDSFLSIIITEDHNRHDYGRNIAVKSLDDGQRAEITALLKRLGPLLPDRKIRRRFPDGRRYQGEIKDGKFYGQGKLTWPDGRVYVGHFRAGKPHGRGRMTWNDGKFYKGDFEAGQMTGDGLLQFPKGPRHTGTFRNGLLHGRGRITLPNGNYRRGTFQAGKLVGRGAGRVALRFGAVYSGRLRDGKATGRGTIRYPDGSHYSGRVKDGLPEGKGTLFHKKKEMFLSGKWERGRLVGVAKGKIRLPSGALYFGEFRKGEPTGQGTIVYGKDSRYVGQVKNGRAHGRGVRFLPGNVHYRSSFRDDRPVGPGQGKVLLPDGRVYFGPLKDGKPHGRGRVKSAGGDYEKMEFVDGRPVGTSE